MTQPWSTQLAQIGYEAQIKFDFYAVALTFTILGLSIQTAKFGTEPAADMFELLAWLSLLIAGIAGMSRLAWQPRVFQLMGLQSSQQDRLSGLREARERGTQLIRTLDTGTDLSLKDLILTDERDLGKIDAQIKKTEGRATWSYRVRSWAFLLGLGALIVARALSPALSMYHLFHGRSAAT